MTSFMNICLKWNNFQENIVNSYHGLREDLDFCDVTLVCEEDKQIEAHRVILSACSPFFSSVMKKNKHSHPMIYMRGLKSKDLVAIVDFIYHGEANIDQEDLDGFLALAGELKLKGLSGSNEKTIEGKKENKRTKYISNPENEIIPKQEISSIYQTTPNGLFGKSDELNGESFQISPAFTTKTIVSFDSNSEDLQVKLTSMMERISGGEMNWRCTVCGKTTKGSKTHMTRHVESHMEGVSHPCNLCGKVSRSSKGLVDHKSVYHRI